MEKKRKKFPKRKRPCIVGKIGKVRDKLSKIIPDKKERITYINALVKDFDEMIIKFGV